MFKRFMSCDVMGFQSVFCTVETQTQMPKPLQTRVQDRRLCFKLTQRKYSAPNKLVCLIEAPKIKHIKERKGKKYYISGHSVKQMPDVAWNCILWW